MVAFQELSLQLLQSCGGQEHKTPVATEPGNQGSPLHGLQVSTSFSKAAEVFSMPTGQQENAGTVHACWL